MRLLHTADWQIGMRAAAVSGAAEGVRAARLEAAREVIAVAQREQVDAVLLAGDTFEDNGVERTLVQRVADILAGFGGPVFVLPGNHDPLMPGSVWEHPAWREAIRVHVLREAVPMDVAGMRLYPCPVLEKRSGKDPTAWIPKEETDTPRIALAHGTVEGVAQDDPDYPIARDAAQRTGVDYLALGHWHSTALYPDADGVVHMAYAGTHETTKFGERDSGNALVVSVEAGQPPQLASVHTGRLAWRREERELRGSGELDVLRETLAAIEGADHTLLEVKLSGVLPAADRETLGRIEELVAARFLYGRIDRAGLIPAPDDAAWVDALPPGAVREAAQRLQALTTQEQPTDPRPARVAARALLELYALAQEVHRDPA